LRFNIYLTLPFYSDERLAYSKVNQTQKNAEFEKLFSLYIYDLTNPMTID